MIRHVVLDIKLCICSFRQADLLPAKRGVQERMNSPLPFFMEVNAQPAQPTDQAVSQDMQQNTEVISQPGQPSQQVVNQPHGNSKSEDRFEGDPSASLDVPMNVTDEPLPQATKEADDLSEIDRVLEGR